MFSRTTADHFLFSFGSSSICSFLTCFPSIVQLKAFAERPLIVQFKTATTVIGDLVRFLSPREILHWKTHSTGLKEKSAVNKEKQNYSFAREKISAYEELIRCNLRVRAKGTIGKSVFCLTVTSHIFWKVWLIHSDWARKSLTRSLSEALTGNKKMKPIALVSLF